jgi:hypothetical protein
MPEFLVPDPFSAFFLFCFVVGLAFVLVSALMGMGQDLAHFPILHQGHVDVGIGNHGAGGGRAGAGDGAHAGAADIGHGQAGAHAQAGAHGHGAHADASATPTVSASPLNLMTVMAFLVWFGGTGYVLYAVYGVFLPLSLLAAVAAGGLAGWLVYLFLVKVLLPGTLAGDLRGQTVIGSTARVTIPIKAGRVGEVVYTLEGGRHSDGARSVDGQPIGHDKEVVIVRYERGIAYVQEWDRFRDDLEGMPASRESALAGHDGQPSAQEADSEKE